MLRTPVAHTRPPTRKRQASWQRALLRNHLHPNNQRSSSQMHRCVSFLLLFNFIQLTKQGLHTLLVSSMPIEHSTYLFSSFCIPIPRHR